MVSGRCHWGIRRACALAMVLVLASCSEDRVTGVGTAGPSGQDVGAEGVLDAQPPQPEDAALDTGDVRPAPDGSVPDSATAADTGQDSGPDATPGGAEMWTYGWMASPWSGCSASCGGGTQTREVHCERADGQRVDDVLCVTTKPGEPTDRPADVQVCNGEPCAECPLGSNICNAQSAQDCNASLDLARQRCQDAGCTPAGPAACFQGGSPSNANCWGAVVECTRPAAAPVYSWRVSDWTSCSAACGGGYQTRAVRCESSQGAAVDEALCQGTRPADAQACNLTSCTSGCPYGANICNAQSEQDCNAALQLVRQRCLDAGCAPSGPAVCAQGGSPSNATCWGAVLECD